MEGLNTVGLQPDQLTQEDLQRIDELNKALTLDHPYADTLPGDMTGGSVHTYESLDKTLRLVTYEMKNLHFWPDVPKDQANNTVEEFDVQNSYGDNASPFFAMGGTPAEHNAEYSRHVAKVKYVGTLRQVHHNLTLVRAAHGPVIAQQIRAGTMYILGQQERYLFEASESKAALEYEGIESQIVLGESESKFKAKAFDGYEDENQSVVYDVKGEILDEDILEDIALVEINNFGQPTDMYLDTKAHSDFSKTFFPKQRIAAPGTQVRGGIIVPDFMSSAGNFLLKSNVFRRPRRGYLTSAIGGGLQPAAPTFSAQPAAATDAASKFEDVDAGDYYYRASSFNQYGESLSTASSLISVGAGQKVTFTLSDVTGALGYFIFRTKVGQPASTAEFIFRVIKGATTTTVVDYNEFRPGLSKAYLMKMMSDNVTFKQLAPLMKMDLALLGTSYRWMQLHYGMPMLFTPRFNMFVKNIGRSTRSGS